MRWTDFKDEKSLSDYILKCERRYTDLLFHRIYSESGNLHAWYNEPNKVQETWRGRHALSLRDKSASWEQVGEVVVTGLLYRCFPEWHPIGLPIGSEARFSAQEAIIHVDVKSHKEEDPDLDKTQDVRPEQISGEGVTLFFPDKTIEYEEKMIEDEKGVLGDKFPMLPPIYDFGEGVVKICVTSFVICVYEFDADNGYQYLRRLQLFTVPNGLLRRAYDFRNIFRAGKDGRKAHRYRIRLPELAKHASWRWRELKFEPYAVVVTR